MYAVRTARWACEDDHSCHSMANGPLQSAWAKHNWGKLRSAVRSGRFRRRRNTHAQSAWARHNWSKVRNAVFTTRRRNGIFRGIRARRNWRRVRRIVNRGRWSMREALAERDLWAQYGSGRSDWSYRNRLYARGQAPRRYN